MSLYAELLSKSKEKLDSEMAEGRAAEMQAAGNLQIQQLKLRRTGLANQLAAAETQYPLNFTAVLNAQDEIALLDRQIGQMEATTKRLFG